jgi:plastocyanin
MPHMLRGLVRRVIPAFAFVAVTMLGIAACGGNGGGSSYKEPRGPAEATVDITGGNFFFDPKNPQAPAGIIAIRLESTQGIHDLVFDGGKVPGFKLVTSGTGKSDELKANLKPGEYSIYCDIPGHREGGMEGTLTVT